MIKYKINTSQLISVILAYTKERCRLNYLQLTFVFYRWLNFKVLDKKSEKTLEEILCLFSCLNKKSQNYYLLGDIKLCIVEPKMLLHLVGMYIDIMVKDEFYDTPVKNEDHKKILFHYYQEGPYENKYVQVNKGDVVIDAGANIGIFSLLAAKKGAKVYSFEPQSYFFSLLCDNISLNHLNDDIVPLCYGISDYKGRFTMHIDRENLLSASIIIKRGEDSCNVNCVSIDQWVEDNNIPRIDFIKVDIEGAERLLLIGARKSIIKWKPKLAISSYHYPDDPLIIKEIIYSFGCNYKIIETKKIIFATI